MTNSDNEVQTSKETHNKKIKTLRNTRKQLKNERLRSKLYY